MGDIASHSGWQLNIYTGIKGGLAPMAHYSYIPEMDGQSSLEYYGTLEFSLHGRVVWELQNSQGISVYCSNNCIHALHHGTGNSVSLA